MNTATNTTTAAPAATTPIEQLIANHIASEADNLHIFTMNDWGMASDESVTDAMGGRDKALIAICKAKASTPADAKIRSEYLKKVLPEALRDYHDLTLRVVDALFNAASEPEVRPAEEAAGLSMLRELMQLTRKIDNVQDILVAATSLNSAVAMAMEARPQGDAIGAITGEVEHKLNLARDQLETLREALS